MSDKVKEIIQNVITLIKVARNELASAKWKGYDYRNPQNKKDFQAIKTQVNLFEEELRYIEERVSYEQGTQKVYNRNRTGGRRDLNFDFVEEMSWLDLYKELYKENQQLQKENDQLKEKLRQLTGEELASHPVDELLNTAIPPIRMPSGKRYKQLCFIYDQLTKEGIKIIGTKHKIQCLCFVLEKNGEQATLNLYEGEREMEYKHGWVVEPLDQDELTGEWAGFNLTKAIGLHYYRVTFL